MVKSRAGTVHVSLPPTVATEAAVAAAAATAEVAANGKVAVAAVAAVKVGVRAEPSRLRGGMTLTEA